MRDDELRGLRVETESGDRVGRAIGVVFETVSGSIVQYRVRPATVLTMFGFGNREFLVHATQIVSITAERMVIRDTDVPVRHRRTKRIFPAPAEQPQSIASAAESL